MLAERRFGDRLEGTGIPVGEGLGMGRKIGLVVVMIVGVTLLLWAGVHNARERRLEAQKMSAPKVVVTPAAGGKADADDSAPVTPKLQGKTAPAFTLMDLNGKKVSLADYKGHAVVLNFWATYCGPCKLEMPWFQDLENKYKGQGLVVLGLDQDDGMAVKEVATASKRVGVTYPILMPDDKVAKSYQLSDYIPETFYVDKSGKIVDQTIGAHSKDELEADIQKAIASGGM